MTLHFLNDIANNAESTQKSKNYVIIASLKMLSGLTDKENTRCTSFDIKFTRLDFENAC